MPERHGGSSEALSEQRPEGETIMSIEMLFAALCAVIAANILVAVFAIIRAYREENRIRRSSRFATGLNRRFI
jgi:hypothetical protein